MNGVFFIVGPTAAGKSDIAAEVACRCGGEIVNADAFQIYRGLDLLTGKPDAATIAKAPHHLIGELALDEEWNAAKFREAALDAIKEIHGRGRAAIVAGGSGLYLKTLTHGLLPSPAPDRKLREQLNALSLHELNVRLRYLDAESARSIDTNNRRRVTRALEICMTTGLPASHQRTQWTRADDPALHGAFVFWNRDQLHARINRRVEMMFENGVIDEVVAASASVDGDNISATASKMIGWQEIRDLLDSKISLPECIAKIQQATRQYAKRQLTWFRRQSNFEPLNLSSLSLDQAVASISQKARASHAPRNV